MTLLVRDEIDIIKENIEFHLNHGVDHIIVTDNGSIDGTRELLGEYQKQGIMYVIDEPCQDYSQSVWVTRMAHLAKEKYCADWMFHNDADEFWYSQSGNLKTELIGTPFNVLSCSRHNFNLDEEVIENNNFRFYDLKAKAVKPFVIDYSCVEKYPFFMYTIGNKIIHKAMDQITIEQGNHFIVTDNKREAKSNNITIYHYPVCRYEQFRAKVINGGASYERNATLQREVGWHWRRWYKLYLEDKLEDEYKTFILTRKQLKAYVQSGHIDVDIRLRDAVANNYSCFVDQSMTEIYDANFYGMHNDWEQEYSYITKELDRILDIDSVLDFGCGNGYLLKSFEQLGKIVVGVEGSLNAIKSIQSPLRNKIYLKDLRKPLYIGKYDLVICSEVAEHIEERYADVLIDNICRSTSKYIYFTAATPDQTGGVNHINLQLQDYWIKKLSDRGFRLLDQHTAQLRKSLESQNKNIVWFNRNSMLFEKADQPAKISPDDDKVMGGERICLVTCFLLDEDMCNVLNRLGNSLREKGFQLIVLASRNNPRMVFPFIQIPYSFADYDDTISLPIDYEINIAFELQNELVQRDIAFSKDVAYRVGKYSSGLKKAAYVFESLLKEMNPAFVLLWGNTLPQSTLQKHICAMHNISVYIFERGLLPKTIMIEKEGHGADSELNNPMRPNYEYNTNILHRYREIRQYYLETRPQKYNQKSYSKIEDLRILYKVGNRKVLLFWGQQDVWSGLKPRFAELSLKNSPWFESTLDAFNYISEIVSKRYEYLLIFKPHPYDDTNYFTKYPNVVIVKNENNQSLMELSDVFIAMCTTMQFEALLYDKPIVLLANSQLRNKGIAYQHSEKELLEDVIQSAIEKIDYSSKLAKSKQFIVKIFSHYLYGYDGAPSTLGITNLSEFISVNATNRGGNTRLITSLNYLSETDSNTAIKLVTFYLPQYHPIPENDQWWGKGFTEWTNVRKAKPLFPGHYQPHVPADLGYYDLRDPKVREAQAELAREYGIHGFCYYHYWFNGKQLLHQPLDEVLATGKPDFPFCLCWANEDWTRAWDGYSGEILVDQRYSEEDDLHHIRWLVEVFRDSRYIRVQGKPLFLVYRAKQLPDPIRTTETWRKEARRLGVSEPYLCRVESLPDEHDDPHVLGFDAAVEFQPDWTELGPKIEGKQYGSNAVYRYDDVVARMMKKPRPKYKRFSCVTPSWDNSPRREKNALIITGSTPALYEQWLKHAITGARENGQDEKILFINAWNEWGEGNHLEPDQKFGKAFLEATRRAFYHNQLSPVSTLDQQHYVQAQAFEQSGKIDAAIAVHELLANAKPDNTLEYNISSDRDSHSVESKEDERTYELAQQLVAQNKYNEALQTLEDLIKTNQNHSLAHNDLGILYTNTGELEKARDHYEKAVQLAPDNMTTVKNLADFTYVALGDIEEAMRMYAGILTRLPNDVETLLLLGQASIKAGDLERAVYYFQRAAVIEPENDIARQVLAKLLPGSTTASSDTHPVDSNNSVKRNLAYWSGYEWPEGGEEWSGSWGGTDNLWSATIYPRIKEYLPAGHILEIAPGFGRCTQYLLTQCKQLTVVDLTQKCIDHCKKRFADSKHIQYFVNDGKSLDMIADDSFDFVFSWDSLVHAESDVLQAYLKQLASKLKQGGCGFIHHSNMGHYLDPVTGKLTAENKHWRSENMTAELFRHYCIEAGLVCLSQEVIAWGGNVLNDCISVFIREAIPSDASCMVTENPDFMKEAVYQKIKAPASLLKQVSASVDSRAVADSSVKRPDDGLICLHPFYFMEFVPQGLVYTCCPAWIKQPIGNIKNSSIEEIWNSEQAQYIRKKMYAGDVDAICNDCCPIFSYYKASGHYTRFDDLEKNEHLTLEHVREMREQKTSLTTLPTLYNLSNSQVCNLNCIMCSRYSIKDQPDLIKKTENEIEKHIHRAKRINLTGMGDPFARPDSRNLLLQTACNNPDLEFDLITNSLLLPKYWEQVKHNKFGSILISVDSATKETYEKIRRGGTWEDLLASLALVRRNKDRFPRGVCINMTVMRQNFRQIPAFIDLAESYGFNVSFQGLRGMVENENIFELNDVSALEKLAGIIQSENARKRNISISWGDLIRFIPTRNGSLNLPPCAEQPSEAHGQGRDQGTIGPSVSIIIPWNQSIVTMLVCIGVILENTDYENYLVVVVVGDGSEEMLNSLSSAFKDDRVQFFIMPKDTDMIKGCKNAAEQASTDYLVFLDPRIIVAQGWLTKLLKTSFTGGVAIAVTPKVIYPLSKIHEAGYSYVDGKQIHGNGAGAASDAPEYNYVTDVNGGSRYCILIPKKAWFDSGGFDTRITEFNLALMDMGFSLRTNGINIRYQPHSVVTLQDPQNENLTKSNSLAPGQEMIDRLRPSLKTVFKSNVQSDAFRKKVLVLGIYLADKMNNAVDIIATLSLSKSFEVVQRWVALGGEPPSQEVAEVTTLVVTEKKPKYQIMNELLEREDLKLYEYVLIIDDDVVLPTAFIDEFISLQSHLEFSLAQPARTSNSYIDHPIVEQQNGLLARQTRFVEIGPVVCFHRSLYDLLFPFDLTSSMGWGYENVWAQLLSERNLKMGIIDNTPVDHSLRKPVEHYDWSVADRERSELLAKNRHLPLEECMTVVEVITTDRQRTAAVIAGLIKNAERSLENADYASTRNYCDQALAQDPSNRTLNDRIFAIDDLMIKMEYRDNSTILHARPKHLTIDPTNKCNARCIICFRSHTKVELTELEAAAFDKITPVIPYARNINLFGSGEAVIAKDFKHMLSETKKRMNSKAEISLTSNGMAITEDIATLLTDSRCILSISMDAGTPQLFEQIRRGAKFDKVVKNLQRFNQLRNGKAYPDLRFACTISKRNIHDVSKIIALAKELQVRNVALYNFYGVTETEKQYELDETDRTVFQEQQATINSYQVNVGNCLSFRSSLRSSTNTSAATTLAPAAGRQTCYSPWKVFMVFANGAVQPCCVIGRKEFGNINQQSFEDIWNGDAYQRLRRSFVEQKGFFEECRECTHAMRTASEFY